MKNSLTLQEAFDIVDPVRAERAMAQKYMGLVISHLENAKTEAIAASLNPPDAELHCNRVREHLTAAEIMLQASNAAEFRAQRMED